MVDAFDQGLRCCHGEHWLLVRGGTWLDFHCHRMMYLGGTRHEVEIRILPRIAERQP